MARLSELTVAEFESALTNDLDPQSLHDVMIRVTEGFDTWSDDARATVVALVGGYDDAALDDLAPRPRTALKLVGAGAFAAAAQVLTDNAVGIVESPAAAGARLPLLTKVEPPRVFADIAGFRDPRLGAPDDCYDITNTLRLKRRIDQVETVGPVISLGGWAAVDILPTSPDEVVNLVVASDEVEVVVSARRRQRPDLVTGPGRSGSRRAWAGWSANLDFDDPRLVDGLWSLAIEIVHAGVAWRAPVGGNASQLAARAIGAPTVAAGRSLSWTTVRKQWRLKLTGHGTEGATPGTVGG